MPYAFENKRVSANMITGVLFRIRNMQDIFLNVTFRYTGKTWNGAIPIISKYQGVEVPITEEDILNWVEYCYAELDPGKNALWQGSQRQHWERKTAFDTQAVFDSLNGTGDLTEWLCRKCGPVPKSNPQPAARIKALKQDGYHIATDKKSCATCGGSQYFDLLVRLPRQAAGNEKRSPISAALQRRIKEVLPLKDVCFDEPHSEEELIIDHKFPSSRWVMGETANATNMPPEDIRRKFQLLTNQSNQQKERYCKKCISTGKRGEFFGIKWYYKGDDEWRGSSKADEHGCEGCCWYDMEKWRERFNEHLASFNPMS